MSLVFKTVEERFDHLFAVLSSERFRRREGLGNEVPFFVAPYPPEQETQMEAAIEDLLIKPLRIQHGITVIHLNLYDLCVEILKENGVWDDILAVESEISLDEKLETMKNCVEPKEFLIPKILEKLEGKDYAALLLSGAGTVYPFLRTHTIFENLQSSIKDRPTVLLFPGCYNYSESNGRVLNLFGEFDDDRYYRAFNLDDYLV